MIRAQRIEKKKRKVGVGERGRGKRLGREERKDEQGGRGKRGERRVEAGDCREREKIKEREDERAEKEKGENRSKKEENAKRGKRTNYKKHERIQEKRGTDGEGAKLKSSTKRRYTQEKAQR